MRKPFNAAYYQDFFCPLASMVTWLTRTAFARHIIRDPVVVDDGADFRRVVPDNPKLTLRTLTKSI